MKIIKRSGAERVLDYYKNGGKVRLTEDDVNRLEMIAHPKRYEYEMIDSIAQ